MDLNHISRLALLAECGFENVNQRIIGGEEADPGRYPWMVALVNPKTKELMCGGTLINNLYILTAAHCLEDEGIAMKPKEIAVALGAHKISEFPSSKLKYAEKLILHPDYDTEDLNDDIALIKLTKPVTFTKYIRPVCLPPASMTTFKSFFVTGWGELGEKKGSSDKLMIVDVPPSKKCSGLEDTQICAGALNRDTCSGDSGGPLQSYYNGRVYVAGVVSYGVADCGTGKPGIYTRVSSYLKWIHKNAQRGVYCNNPMKPF